MGTCGHQISYCADRRVVKIERVASKVPNLPTTLDFLNEPGGVIYAGYVSSEYLDAHVNQQRTDFDTIPVRWFPATLEKLSWEEIGESVLAASRRYLAPYTDEVRTKKQRRIQEYVNSSAPQYRFILKHHPETLDRIPSEVSDDVLDTKLYEMSRDIDTSLRQKGESNCSSKEC